MISDKGRERDNEESGLDKSTMSSTDSKVLEKSM